MRAFEFYTKVTENIEDKDVEEIKQMIVQRVQTLQDSEIIKKLYNVVMNSGTDVKIQQALQTDDDSKKYAKRLVADVMETEGTIEEKKHFAENFSKGFINVDKLLDNGNPHSFDDLLINTIPSQLKDNKQPFVYRVFQMLVQTYSEQGVGPGEIALAILSPLIKRVGGGNEAVGDLEIQSGSKVLSVEVKGKSKGTSGRLDDAKVKIMDAGGVARVLQQYGQKGQRVSLTSSTRARSAIGLVGGENSIVKNMDPQSLPNFANDIAKEIFHYSPEDQSTAATYIQNNDEGLKQFYTKVLFNRYFSQKSKEGNPLAGFLLVNAVAGRTMFSKTWEDLGDRQVVDGIYLTDPSGNTNMDSREYSPPITIGVN